VRRPLTWFGRLLQWNWGPSIVAANQAQQQQVCEPLVAVVVLVVLVALVTSEARRVLVVLALSNSLLAKMSWFAAVARCSVRGHSLKSWALQ